MAKILYVENGRPSDAAMNLEAGRFKKIGICDLKRANLLLYDIVIIPSYSNQDVLKTNFKRLEHFVKYGGILVTLGATQDKVDWLPFCSYNKPFLENVRFKHTDIDDARIIFSDTPMTQDAIQFHDEFVSHGSFVTPHRNCTPLITSDDGVNNVLAVIKPHGLAGKVLITTLDPDYHAVCGHTRKRKNANPQAKSLLTGIIAWAEQQVHSHDSFSRISRYVIGLSRSIVIQSGIILSVSLCLASILGYLLGWLEKDAFAVIASMASISSLGLSVFQYWFHAT